uniref:ATP-dependent Clp protease proteolytic subunit n=1 Tax=Anchomanes hookeri TaxID=2544931 RepID=A0A6B9TZM3_9ARAE|nr:ATP-dependent Clp protease proteolytic subunit [Anchomanes hookeri]
MPVGVPKVPYQGPGDGDAVWFDLYNRLYRERILFLGKEVDSEIANQLIGLMVYLNMYDDSSDIFLFINSPGGWVLPGVALFDTMQTVLADVNTVCIGVAASTGSFVLVGGEITKRMAFPHARVMIHQPASSFFSGIPEENIMEVEEVLHFDEIIKEAYVQRTGNSLEVIIEALDRDIFMSAEEAKDFGVIDLIGDELLLSPANPLKKKN